MEKVTIHRALAELKIIGDRITKQIEAVPSSGIVQKDKLVNGIYPKTDFEKDAKEKYQSVNDLIDRRTKIKSAIVKANAITVVQIGSETMTIAEAINLKATILYRKSLIETLKRKHQKIRADLEKNNAQVDANALQLATVALGKQGIKLGDNDVKAVIEPYLEMNRFSLVDPLGIEAEITKQEAKISTFETEVDAVLSEINAVTTIEF